MNNLSVYIHIPFCDHKCIYCDFYSIITNENEKSFINAVKREIEFYSKKYGKQKVVETIYFGGGTPSLLPVNSINDILKKVKQCFNVTNDCEITLETNPGTVDKDKLRDFKNIGINRLSIGVQSFLQKDLNFLTRIHNRQTAISTIVNAADIGFSNLSVDLIFNLPHQTKDEWLNNLSLAAELPISHISTYSLIIERGTILNKMILDGKVRVGDEDFDADLYKTTISFLSIHDFMQYEVSNFARGGLISKHNLNYWNYGNYLGFGPSAHSFINRKRWWNYSSLKKYISEIMHCGHAQRGYEELSEKQMLEEYIMLSLRSTGVNLNELNRYFGDTWFQKNNEKLKILEKKKLISFEDKLIRLTPEGYLICDEILLNLN